MLIEWDAYVRVLMYYVVVVEVVEGGEHAPCHRHERAEGHVQGPAHGGDHHRHDGEADGVGLLVDLDLNDPCSAQHEGHDSSHGRGVSHPFDPAHTWSYGHGLVGAQGTSSWR